MTYDSNNIFAKILRGEIPCDKLHEDDHCIAFHDIAPKAKTHILVIPKIDCQNAQEFHESASTETISHFYKTVTEIAEKEIGLNNGGYRILANSGPNAGQEVPHYHMHILGGEQLKGL